LCSLSLSLPGLLLVLLRSFDTWFLWVNLFIMLIVVAIAEFSKTDASPLLFSWAESLEHEQVCLLFFCHTATRTVS
jgi:hypothetical protein